jgi:DNA-binding NarL/FixJ family response regulator
MGNVGRLCRTLLVDDSPDFLRAITSLLSAVEGIEIVGVASTGREALQRVAELEPDLVLMDLIMPEMDGLEATRRLVARPRPPRVILMTAHDDEEYRAAAGAAGADGFLFKSESGAILLPLIRSLLSRNEPGITSWFLCVRVVGAERSDASPATQGLFPKREVIADLNGTSLT